VRPVVLKIRTYVLYIIKEKAGVIAPVTDATFRLDEKRAARPGGAFLIEARVLRIAAR
jgi:hypothetical protein